LFQTLCDTARSPRRFGAVLHCTKFFPRFELMDRLVQSQLLHRAWWHITAPFPESGTNHQPQARGRNVELSAPVRENLDEFSDREVASHDGQFS
jgi:hypothetical protein